MRGFFIYIWYSTYYQMKHLFVALYFTLSIFNGVAQRQNDSAKKSIGLIIKVDLFNPATGLFGNLPVYDFSIEKFTGKHTSIQLTGFYDSFHDANNGVGYPVGQQEYIIATEVKYFLSKRKTHKGIYVGFLGLYDHIHIISYYWSSGYTGEGNGYNNFYGPGVLAGVQYYIFKRIDVDLLIGLSKGLNYIYWTDTHNNIISSDTHQFTFDGIANLNIGYKF